MPIFEFYSNLKRIFSLQGKFLIIFAITSEYKTIYDALSKQIDNSEVAILEKDAEEDRIVNIISTDFITYINSPTPHFARLLTCNHGIRSPQDFLQ